MGAEVEDVVKPWSYRHYDVDLVRYVLKLRPLCRPMLMHLLYLIDREVCLKYGNYMFNWEMTHAGPSSGDVLYIINNMVKYGAVFPNYELGYIIYEHKSIAPITLPDELRATADRVLDAWGRKKLDELVSYVQSLDEIKNARQGEHLRCVTK
jgi:hypothetical protein